MSVAVERPVISRSPTRAVWMSSIVVNIMFPIKACVVTNQSAGQFESH